MSRLSPIISRLALAGIGLASATLALAGSTASGHVLGPAGVTPIPGARVVFYNVLTGITTQSDPTDDTGAYDVSDLEAGRYDVAVDTERGLWLVERPLEIGAGETREMTFALRESTYWEGTHHQPPRTSPIGSKIVGTAVLLETEKGSPERWPKERRRKVILGSAIGGGVIAVALAAGDNGSSNASPSMP
ncbi:MAG: carboxypeptidase-like regulatory domain-containing protein [Acidobacteriota bacterium]